MPRIALTIAALLAAVVAATGCGSDRSTASSPSAVVPAGSFVYAEATLHPGADQQAALDSLISKFPGEGSARERIRGLLEKAVSKADLGLSYSKDIEPWLGDKAGFFVSTIGAGKVPSAAAVIATDDEDAAQAAIDKAKGGKDGTYRGHDFRTFPSETSAGIVDGWVVVGTNAGFKAAVDTVEDDKPLDDDATYQHALAGATQHRLGFLYLDMSAVAKQLSDRTSLAGPFADFFKEPILATVDVTQQGVRLEANLPKSLTAILPVLGKGGERTPELPADSWLAISQPNLGETIGNLLDVFTSSGAGRGALEQQIQAATGLDLKRDVLSWMGDFSLFVRGTSVSQLNGALVVETSDEAASRRFIDKVAQLARKAGHLTRIADGYELRLDSLDQPLQLFQRDGKVVLAYGASAAHDALAPGARLGDTQGFKDAQSALGSDYKPALYLSLPQVVSLIDSTGAHDSEIWQKIKPYLEPLGAIAAGAKQDGDQLRSALVVTVP
jgi:uncharacterized protein DUF3352